MLKILCLLLLTLSPLDTLLDTLGVSNAQSLYQEGERWNFQDRFENKREEILPILEEMGFFEEKRALKNHYHYGVILGALHSTVEKRIELLIQEWNKGVRFDSIVFLTGERPLHPVMEKDFSGTETDMMIETWRLMDIPKKLRALPLIIVDAPPLPERGRPTTESTLYAWLEMNPEPGTALFFSNQPFVMYQDAIIQAVLPSDFTAETIGSGGGREYPISVLLDTVAKWIYWKNPQIH